MSDWNEACSIHKAKKIGQLDAKVIKGVNKNKKPKKEWHVYGPMFGKEYRMYSAATKEQCEKWLEKKSRWYYSLRTYKNSMDAATVESRAEEKMRGYRIVGPMKGE